MRGTIQENARRKFLSFQSSHFIPLLLTQQGQEGEVGLLEISLLLLFLRARLASHNHILIEIEVDLRSSFSLLFLEKCLSYI